MPRQSPEARGAAAFRAGGAPLEPPKHLSKEAAALWLAITACKPPDWFDPASAVLLEEFCEVATHLRALHQRLARLREAGVWAEAAATERRWLRLGARLAGLAQKLRLTPQAGINRKSRMLDERGSGGAPRNPLLGGEAVWGRPRMLSVSAGGAEPPTRHGPFQLLGTPGITIPLLLGPKTNR
jgi:hypothetical protein